jgi:hypothetical protein
MAILKKLETLLNNGITTEIEIVYLMSGLRKLIEQQQANKTYKHLTFHCNWTLHSKLDRSEAQEVLSKFDAANLHLKRGLKLHQLPTALRNEVDNISQMKYFENELTAFLKANGLPGIDAVRHDGWIHFEHLYVKVVEDCPLVISSQNATTVGIESVTVSCELANQMIGDHMMFKVIWTILDKNGTSGDIFIINSLSQK